MTREGYRVMDGRTRPQLPVPEPRRRALLAAFPSRKARARVSALLRPLPPLPVLHGAGDRTGRAAAVGRSVAGRKWPPVQQGRPRPPPPIPRPNLDLDSAPLRAP